MTDREIALELGRRLLLARFRIAAMTGELSTYRDRNWEAIPWRQHVDETLSRSLSHDFEAQIDALSHELDASTPEELLRTLHAFLVEDWHLR